MEFKIGNIQPWDQSCDGIEVPATPLTSQYCLNDDGTNGQREYLEMESESPRGAVYAVTLPYRGDFRVRIHVYENFIHEPGLSVALLGPEQTDNDLAGDDVESRWFETGLGSVIGNPAPVILAHVNDIPVYQSTTFFALGDIDGNGEDDCVVIFQGGERYMIPIDSTQI